MTERAEEDKLLQSGITVTLGGKEYNVAPLVIKYSGEWRKTSLPLIDFLLKYSHMKSEEQELALLELFTTKMDKILDSFFGYARDLDREEIEGIATDSELLIAFMEVFSAFVSPLSVKPPVKNKT